LASGWKNDQGSGIVPAIVYIHGFLSSPHSHKAQLLGDFLRAGNSSIDYVVPALPEEPALALAAAEQAVLELHRAGAQPVGRVGSSMGGFYATVLALRHGLRAVLVNPSIAPQHRIRWFFGPQVNPYSGRHFVLDASHAEELASMSPAAVDRKDDFWLLAQCGDEVLDYREAERFYAGCRQTIEPGGDHQFQGFERHLPAVLEFLGR
jgi:predicted esterase YcpF (UPF0227 family)